MEYIKASKSFKKRAVVTRSIVKDIETNVIHCGDCKDALKGIPDNSVDLIYLDPPFFSQRNYENFWIKDKLTNFKFTDKEWEKLRHSVDSTILKEYDEMEKRWMGGHKGIYVYIAYMRERLNQCWRVLKPTGSIYLHCDWHAGHYLKVMMDEVFGYSNFRNEIIWKRTNSPKGSQFKPKKYGAFTDSILFYTKSDDYVFELDRIRLPLSFEELKQKYKRQDEFGPYTVGPIICSASMGERPNLVYSYKGYTAPKWGWRMVKEKLISLDQKGNLGWTSKKTPFRKLRPSGDRGHPLGNIWDGIYKVGSGETIGYPTQKPEALLERIIKASSNEDDIVLDPFCGCGTSGAVALKLGRRFIGMDVSRMACDVTRNRLGKKVKVVGGETLKELGKMDPHEFARFIINEKLGGTVNPKKTGDGGIDGWIDFMTTAVQVKRWEHKVGRPEVDKFFTAVQRDKKNKGLIVAFEFSKDCYEEVARIKKEHSIELNLLGVNELLK